MGDSLLYTTDTLSVFIQNDTIRVAVCSTAENYSGSWLDTTYKLAMIAVGICNLTFAFFLFYYNKNKEEKKAASDNRKKILHEIVLKYKMQVYYDIFSDLIKYSHNLIETDGKCMDEKKSILNDKFQDLFSSFRLNFAEILGAVDNNLYKKIMKLADDLQGELSKNLFDTGVNLDVVDKYKEMIEKPILNAQRDILEVVNQYE